MRLLEFGGGGQWHSEHTMPQAQHITRTSQFQASVADLALLSPRMRRITLRSPAIAAVRWPLASDIAVVLTGPDGREVRRRYTVRATEGDTLIVDALLHGHGPGSSWAAALELGSQVSFFGPRGEITLPPAAWLLAVTDESGLPAIGAVAEAAEAAGRSLRVLAEIADGSERYPLPAATQVSWLLRNGRPAGHPELLAAGLHQLPAEPGRGYGYVLGESRAVVALRDALGRFGLSRADVHAKGYWNLNSRPTR
jgi:NADPH-dependent ferric siderophore reductase